MHHLLKHINQDITRRTVCKGYQQTTILGKEKLQQCISNQLAGFHLVVCIYNQSRKQYVS